MYGIVIKIHLYAGSGDQLVGGRNHVKKVVLLLIEKYINKGHSLYIDNYYTSVGLAEELLNKNTYVTGTLRAKRAGNPTIINTKLKAGESCIVHNKRKIVVTKWQDKREVLLLSSEDICSPPGAKVCPKDRRIESVNTVLVLQRFFPTENSDYYLLSILKIFM